MRKKEEMKTEEENENMEQVEKPETKGVPYWIYWLSLFLVAVICIIDRKSVV